MAAHGNVSRSPRPASCGQQAPASDAASAIQVSARAAQRLAEINRREGAARALRVLVDAGGCHGFQYRLELTDRSEEDDVVFERDGSRVVVDAMSLDMIRGSTIDFVDELIGSSFQVVGNPNAESACGCKTSFSIKI